VRSVSVAGSTRTRFDLAHAYLWFNTDLTSSSSSGKLEYQINNSSNSEQARPTILELDASRVGIIEPTVLHQVRPLTDDVEFVVEFHRLPGTGPVDEKRE